MGGKGRRPSATSQPERWVIENEVEIERVQKFLDLIGNIELTWREAGVLLHHYYSGFTVDDVADIVGCHVTEAVAANDTLIKKVAVALGYVTAKEAGVTLTLRESPVMIRRRQVKGLHEKGFNMTRIAQEMGISRWTVKNDLKNMDML